MRCTGFAADRPILAGGLTVLTAAVAWVAVSLVLRRNVDPVTTIGFAVMFAAGYLGVALATTDRGADGDWP